jgi:DNA polymerase sigma
MVVSFLQRHPKVAAGHILPDQNFGAMLIEILELYGTRFNYDRVGIAVDRGGYYFDKLELQSLNQKLWRQICIRDPNDESNNIAKASHQVDNIIKVFSDAFREITTRCYVVHHSIRSENGSGGSNSTSILDAILYPQKSLGSRTKLPISDSGPNPSTSNMSRRERRQKERSIKDGSKINREVARTATDMSNRRGVERDSAPKEATIGVGATKETPILLDDSTEQSPSFVISESNRTPKNKNESGRKKLEAGKSRVVVKLQPKTSV